MRRKKLILTKTAVMEALRKTHGLVSPAAELLGTDRTTLYRAIKRFGLEDFQRQMREEVIGDVAELKLFEAIKQGKPWAVALYLKTLGRHRGYVERQEVASVEEVRIRLVEEDGPDD
ncbi:helix-turn-helix domain-containing protein [Thermus sp. NEB1569]|uniref:helix-turn-helix domain-containing protein n=1 Tax=Thermus sp. NEB1569 TaxID=2918899 RepID=UPI001EFACD54|nr:helix-turn-helix domain-containing protein [Thermus sp. NEB1569]ULR41385.1 hypothetical protein MI302_03715 [Thermus sp. NEB1569]